MSSRHHTENTPTDHIITKQRQFNSPGCSVSRTVCRNKVEKEAERRQHNDIFSNLVDNPTNTALYLYVCVCVS